MCEYCEKRKPIFQREQQNSDFKKTHIIITLSGNVVSVKDVINKVIMTTHWKMCPMCGRKLKEGK